MEFEKPEEISKVIIYSPNIMEMDIQVDKGDNKWQTLTSIKREAKGDTIEKIEAEFTPVLAKKIRLDIKKVLIFNKYKYAKITEVEVYR